MNKKIINTILLTMCSLNVFAAPLFNASIIAEAESTIKQSGTEVNFSGTWESDDCMDGNLKRISIVQDNQGSIQFDNGTRSIIGALETATTISNASKETKPESKILSVDWNLQKTLLLIRGVSVIKEPSTEVSEESTGYNLYVNNYIIGIWVSKHGELRLRTLGASYRDLELIDGWDEACKFNKVAEAPEHKINSLSSLTTFRKNKH